MTVLFLASVFFFVSAINLFAENLEVNGDNIQYSVDGKKVIVTGNVEIKQLDTILTSDYAEYTKSTNMAYARGHVVVVSPEKKIVTDEITYDFSQKKITTVPTKISAPPIYASSQNITTNDNGAHVLKTGTFTMSDYDDPEYHFASSKTTIDQKKHRLTARNVRLKIGRIPVFYWPYYSHNLNNKHTPGHHQFGKASGWGHYVLNRWDYKISDHVNGVLRLDYRQFKDIASGVDMHYDTQKIGKGMIRTYYMDEYDYRDPDTTTERYFGELRHVYKPDEATYVTVQAFRLTDNGILGDYFSRRHWYDGDPLPPTFISAIRYLSYGALTFRADPRINDFYGQSEHLPEVRYDIPDIQIANTGLYWKNTTSVASLTHRPALDWEVDNSNNRLDFDQEFSYPIQAGILHLTPFAGSRHTYYQKTLDSEETDIVRGDFNSGMSASTKFFRTYNDVHGKFLGQEFNGIRHVITPNVTYEYMSHPTINADNLYPFDAVDTLRGSQFVRFMLENRFQTIREKDTPPVQFMRASIGTSYNMDNRNGIDKGFQTVDFSVEVNPVNWIVATMSGAYDIDRDTIVSWNGDMTVTKGRWSTGAGYRYNAFDVDLFTTYIGFDPDRKWHFKIYERFDTDGMVFQEQEYSLSRDFHAWVIDMRYNHTVTRGEESWIIFRFKELGGVSKVQDNDGAKYHAKRVGVIENVDPNLQKGY